MGCGPSKNDLAAEAADVPLPKSHPMLESLFQALDAEYGQNKEGAVGAWLEKLPEFGRGGDIELKAHDVDVDDFTAWVEDVQKALRKEATSLHNLQLIWKVGKFAPAPVAVAMPMMQPAQQPPPQQMAPQPTYAAAQPMPQPMAQPMAMPQPMPMQQPGTNISVTVNAPTMPQQPMMQPMMQPGMMQQPMGMQPGMMQQPMGMMPQQPMAQPMMQPGMQPGMMQPGMAVAQPAYGANYPVAQGMPAM